MFESIDGDVMIVRTNHCSGEFLRKVTKLRTDSLFIDVIIRVLDKDEPTSTDIEAHKLILSCCSPYFEAMFSKRFPDDAKTDSGQIPIVEISGPDLTTSGLSSIIDYMYTGLIRIDPTNVWDTLAAADFLLLAETRKTILESYLTKMVDLANCLTCKRMGEMYGCDLLIESADSFIVRNFAQIFRQNESEFCRQIDNVCELAKWLKEDSLSVPSEDFLVNMIEKWCLLGPLEDIAKRTEKLETLLPLVRWSNVSESVISHLKKQFNLESLQNVSKETKPTIEKQRGRNRFLLAVGHDSKEIEILELDNISSGFKVLAELPLRYGLSGASIASYHEYLIVTGGVKHGGILNSVSRVLVYNFRSNKWSQGPDLNDSRKRHSSVAMQGNVFVLGGTDGEDTCNSMEILDITKPFPTRQIKTGSKSNPDDPFGLGYWSKVNGTNVLGTNASYTLATANGTLYAITTYYIGMEGHTRSWFADCYFDNSSKEWKRLEVFNSRTNRDRPGVVGHEGFIYAVGGTVMDSNGHKKRTNLVEKLDLQNGSWIRLPDLNIPRENPGLVHAGEKLFVVGGRVDEEHQGCQGPVEVLENDCERWQVLDIQVKHTNEDYSAVILESSTEET